MVAYRNNKQNTGVYNRMNALDNFRNNFNNVQREQYHGNTAAFMDRAYKDPWFALGEVIGGAVLDNYKQRGLNKLVDSYGEEISPTVNSTEKQGALNASQNINKNYANADMASNNGKDFMSYTDKLKLAKEYEEPMRNPYHKVASEYPNSGQLFKTPEQEEIDKVGLARSGVLRVPDQKTRNTILGQDTAGVLRGPTESNPNELERTSGALDIQNAMAVNRLANFNANDWTNAKVLDMRKKGYSDYDISRMLGPLVQKAQNLQEQKDNATVAQLTDAYTNALNAGDFNLANRIAMEVDGYNQRRGGYMLNGGVTPQAQFSAINQFKLADKNQQYALQRNAQLTRNKAALQDHNMMNRAKYAQYLSQNGYGTARGGSSAGSRASVASQGGASGQQLNIAKQVLDDYAKWQESHGPEEEYPQMDEVNAARQLRRTAMGMRNPRNREDNLYNAYLDKISVYKNSADRASFLQEEMDNDVEGIRTYFESHPEEYKRFLEEIGAKIEEN